MKGANTKFAMELQKFFKTVAKKKRVEVVKDVALEFYIRLTENSPVASGCYRANWGADIDKNYSDADKTLTKDDWSERESEVLEVIDSFSDNDKAIKFANNLPYARRIEFGWSQQAPSGVARVSRAEVLAYIKEKYGK